MNWNGEFERKLKEDFVRIDGALCYPDGWVMSRRIDGTTLDRYLRLRLAEYLSWSLSDIYGQVTQLADSGSSSAAMVLPAFNEGLAFNAFIARLHACADALPAGDPTLGVIMQPLMAAEAVFGGVITGCNACKTHGVVTAQGEGVRLLAACQPVLNHLLEGLYAAIDENQHGEPVQARYVDGLDSIAHSSPADSLEKRIGLLRARTVNIQASIDADNAAAAQQTAKKQAGRYTVRGMLIDAAKRALPAAIADFNADLAINESPSWREVKSAVAMTGNAKNRAIAVHDALDAIMASGELTRPVDGPLLRKLNTISSLLSIAADWDAKAHCDDCQLLENFFGEPVEKRSLFVRNLTLFKDILTPEEWHRAAVDEGIEEEDEDDEYDLMSRLLGGRD